MRIFLGFLVAAVALAAAVWLHSGYKARSFTGNVYTSHSYDGRPGYVPGTVRWKASWQDPVAILIAIAGIGAGVAIVRPRARSAGER